MKISKTVLAMICLGCIFLFGAMTVSAASYDIKSDVTHPATVADVVTVSADKVMNGISDITVTLENTQSNTKQRIMLQCDVTQQTITAFYYLNDVLGGKAKGANGFQVNVYGDPAIGFKHNGEVKVFDSTKDKDNLRTSFDRLKKLNGVGFISFEFFETNGDIDHSTIAHSMLFSSGYLQEILKAMDAYPDVDGCSINAGAVSVYALKNLTDTIQ